MFHLIASITKFDLFEFSLQNMYGTFALRDDWLDILDTNLHM